MAIFQNKKNACLSRNDKNQSFLSIG